MIEIQTFRKKPTKEGTRIKIFRRAFWKTEKFCFFVFISAYKTYSDFLLKFIIVFIFLREVLSV